MVVRIGEMNALWSKPVPNFLLSSGKSGENDFNQRFSEKLCTSNDQENCWKQSFQVHCFQKKGSVQMLINKELIVTTWTT